MKKVYLNIDQHTSVCPFLDAMFASGSEISEEMLYSYIDVYKKTDVTDILFNIFGQLSTTPSEYIEDITSVCEYELNEGRKSKFHSLYTLYKEHGIDHVAVWIKRCRENGHTPWLSFRMSDCHPPKNSTEKGYKAFFSTVMENGWNLGEEYGWYQYGFNYRIKEVRERLLLYMEEQLLRYNVDGVELDFMRDPTCFKYLTEDMDECTEIMNSFIRDVKKMIVKLEEIQGHKIKILVRVPRDIPNAKYFGFDPVAWSKEGFIDVLVTTPRFTGNDSGIPIKEWKEAMGDVEVAGGIETSVNYFSERGAVGFASAEISRGLAASYIAQGADGVYFFNHFINTEETSNFRNNMEPHSYLKNLSVLQGCGSMESIYKNPVRFAIIPQADEAYVKPYPMWQPLPATLCEGEERSFEVTTGVIPEGKRIYLVVCADKGAESFTVTLNGHECNNWSNINLLFMPGIGTQPMPGVEAVFADYVSNEAVCKKCPVDHDNMTELAQNITIKASNENAHIEWIELFAF